MLPSPLLVLSVCLLQGRDTAVHNRLAAVFDGGSVTWDEYHLELARRHRGRPLGREALDHLIGVALVRLEAARRKLARDPAAVERRRSAVGRGLAAAQKSLPEFLAAKGLTPAEFDEYLQLSLWTERLVRDDLGLEGRPSPAQVRLWTNEAARRHGVVRDPAKLPPDTCALVAGRRIPLTELGAAMDRNLAASDRRAILEQMVAYRILKREAEARGLSLTRADLEAELARRREAFAKKPRLARAGIGFDDVLKAEGRTLEDLMRGETFLAQVWAAKLGRVLFPDAELRARFEKDPLTWRERVGPSRLGWRIFVQGPPRRPLKEAKALLERLRPELDGLAAFQAAAQRYGEGPESPVAKGRLGWLHRREEGRDPRMLQALFALPIGRVSEPIEEFGGVSLLLVTQTRPGPEGEKLLEEMRALVFRDWLRARLKAAKIRFLPKVARRAR